MLSTITKKSLVLYLLLLVNLSLFGQNSNYQFTAISSKDGLSSNTVNAILKDRYGFVWFATEDGLTRFDGVNYTIYRHNSKDSTSLWSNEVTSLHEDRSGH